MGNSVAVRGLLQQIIYINGPHTDAHHSKKECHRTVETDGKISHSKVHLTLLYVTDSKVSKIISQENVSWRYVCHSEERYAGQTLS